MADDNNINDAQAQRRPAARSASVGWGWSG